MRHFPHHNKNEKGFTLFVAIIITSTLLLVSMGLIAVSVQESFLTSAGRDSQNAFYAADSAIECALYWDVNNPSGVSAFATSSQTTINCNQDSANNPNPSNPVGGPTQPPFTMTFFSNPGDPANLNCAKVYVTKNDDGTTVIDSHGYNTCNTTNPRRVERAIRVKY